MNRKKAIFIPLAIVFFIALAGFVVQQLWNYVTPALSDQLHPIDYWHALGLLVLCKLLFGGFHKGGHRGGGPGGWVDKQRKLRDVWRTLDDDQRARLKEEWKRHCGPWGRGGMGWNREGGNPFDKGNSFGGNPFDRRGPQGPPMPPTPPTDAPSA